MKNDKFVYRNKGAWLLIMGKPYYAESFADKKYGGSKKARQLACTTRDLLTELRPTTVAAQTRKDK